MTEEVVISSILSEKGMIARLATKGWGGRVTDKIVTQELTEGKNAEKDSASVTKALINKEHLKRIRDAVSGMKKYHNEQTLPWDNNGGRLLPSTKFNEYTMKFREAQRELEAAVVEFLQNYQEYVSEAEGRLGDLFVQDDYPSVEELEGKFELTVDFEKVPESGDFRVDIPEHEQQRIRTQIEDRVHDQHASAMKRVWTRMFKAVEHMHERLSQEDAIFHSTLIENIEQLVDVLPSLNILNDETLDELTRELKDNLCGYTPDDLRQNKVLRQEVSAKSKEIRDKISQVGDFFADNDSAPAEQDTLPAEITPDNAELVDNQDQDQVAA